MAKWQLAVVGADNAAAHLRLMEKNLLSFNRAFEDIGTNFREQVAEQFAARGSLPGVRGINWAPLAPRTIALRKGGNRQLVRTGALMNSYITPGAPSNISNISNDKARFGSSNRKLNGSHKMKPIARFHQEGTRRMTARPVVLWSRPLDEAIVDAFADHIFDGWI